MSISVCNVEIALAMLPGEDPLSWFCVLIKSALTDSNKLSALDDPETLPNICNASSISATDSLNPVVIMLNVSVSKVSSADIKGAFKLSALNSVPIWLVDVDALWVWSFRVVTFPFSLSIPL